MKMTMRALVLAMCAVLVGAVALATPKNVILLIGDGMSPESVWAAGAYKYGKDYHVFGGREKMAMETLTGHLYSTTYSSQGHGYDFGWAGGNREYVKTRATDSAAAGTALATGVKTYDAAIGVDPNKQPLTSIVEIAKRRGMRTGVVSSVPFSHATPAAFAAHNEHRNNYTAITNDMIFKVQPDVIMGAGHPDGAAAGKEYEYITKEDWEALAGGQTPYTLIQDRAQFRQLVANPLPGKVFGAYRNHFCLKYRLADGTGADPALPTLAEMTEGALASLKNENGFFLMVEGGAIDWCNHANDLNGSIGETLDFDDTVAATLRWIARNGGWKENLLIITADHDTGYLNDVQPTEKGKLPTVKWGTGDKPWTSHTNRLVDVFFQGDTAWLLAFRAREATDFERGKIRYIDNTDIFKAMKSTIDLLPTRTPAGMAAAGMN